MANAVKAGETFMQHGKLYRIHKAQEFVCQGCDMMVSKKCTATKFAPPCYETGTEELNQRFIFKEVKL